MEIVIKDQISAVLDQLGAKRPAKAVSEAMALTVVSMTIRSFNEPALRAAPWPALKEATVREKAKRGGANAILKRSTLLFRSWRVIEATAAHARVGSDRPYAAPHQWGTKRGLPARPMLPLVGGPEDATFTPLAVRRMTSVGKAALESLLRR
ncbi:MAG TPA: phage virion morphogenesis protein [Opitutaceae bacterium]|nr:phage virion morphogenesis protein [Opitutaceae bacterium]